MNSKPPTKLFFTALKVYGPNRVENSKQKVSSLVFWALIGNIVLFRHTFPTTNKPNCIKSPKRVSTAVIVPYKDREEHLKLLLRYLHPNLQRQKISYCIFIAEQFHDGRFNKKGFLPLYHIAYIRLRIATPTHFD